MYKYKQTIIKCKELCQYPQSLFTAPKLLGDRPNEKHQKGFEIPTYASLKDLNSHAQNFTWSFFVRMICENGHYIP